MRRSIATGLSAVLFASFIAACDGGGGRGSSGFDITDSAVIDEVLRTGECAELDGLIVCPSEPTPTPETTRTLPRPTGTALNVTPSATPTPQTPLPKTPTTTPTRPEGQVITTTLGRPDVACVRDAVGGPCLFTFEFTAFNFPSTASFDVVLRGDRPTTPWLLQDPPSVIIPGDPITFAATVSVPAELQGRAAQVVILVSLDGTAEIPSEFPQLQDSGADLAYVQENLNPVAVGPLPTPTPTATPVPVADGPRSTDLGPGEERRIVVRRTFIEP